MSGLVIATGNAHKVEELRALIPGVPLTPLSDYPDAPDPVEDAPDFIGNAIIKAKSAHQHTGRPCLADDSGICVDCLGGAPGVRSARYIEGTDADRRHALLRRTRRRRAGMLCNLGIALHPAGGGWGWG